MTDQPNTEPAAPGRRPPLLVRLYRRIHPLVPIVLAVLVGCAGVVWFDPDPAVRREHITPDTLRFWTITVSAAVFILAFTVVGSVLLGAFERVWTNHRPSPDTLRAIARGALIAVVFAAVFFLPINIGIVSNDAEAGINATGYSTLIGVAVVVAVALLWRALGRRPDPGVLVGHRSDGTAVYLTSNAPLLAALAGAGRYDDALPPAAADALTRIEDQQGDILDRLDDIALMLRALSYSSRLNVETERLLQKIGTPATTTGNGG